MEKFYSQLIEPSSPVEDKYVAIFELKQLATIEAVSCLKKAFKILNEVQEPSCLLLHEIAYSLGQLPLSFAEDLQGFLIEIIKDTKHFDIVRHEAAEALANLCPDQDIELFKQQAHCHENDENNIFSDTCDLAISKIESYSSLSKLYGQKYSEAREPAAPFSEDDFLQKLSTNQIIEYICLTTTRLFDKYRALYYIRDQKQPDAIIQMTNLLLNKQLGALLKHEISFILGQIGSDCPHEVVPILIQVSSDVNCPSIVRHEALAAFQTVHPNKAECKEYLLRFTNDPDQIVRETVRVSLKVSEFWGQ